MALPGFLAFIDRFEIESAHCKYHANQGDDVEPYKQEVYSSHLSRCGSWRPGIVALYALMILIC